MRAVLQRVTRAAVRVDGRVVGEIVPGPGAQGLLALVGVAPTDDDAAVAKMAAKIHGLRILDGERSAADTGAPILVISQFTLYGDARKGRRPTWQAAAPGTVAEPLVDAVVKELRELGAEVATGVFGAQMSVDLTNEGPFTVVVEV